MSQENTWTVVGAALSVVGSSASIRHPQSRLSQLSPRMEAGNFGDHSGVGGGVMECRIHSGPGYRIYAAVDKGTVIILLGGGTKRNQQSDIANAQDRWKDYKNRKTYGGQHATHP